MNKQRVAILDAGAQYGKVIDRRVRGLGVFSEILPIDTPAKILKNYDAIIISGGPQSVYGDGAPRTDAAIFDLGKPILGICYGMQLLSYHYGGTVSKGSRREDGASTLRIKTDSKLFKDLPKAQTVLMSHGDSVATLPNGFVCTAKSSDIVAAIEDKARKLYGVQFHPEVDITEHGQKIIGNFLFEVAKLKADYTLQDREKEAIRYIQKVVGNKDVLVFVSGGVDSTVCTVLLAKALDPKQVHAVHIDTGFMRANESKMVVDALKKAGIDVLLIDASVRFMNASTTFNGKQTTKLSETSDPETKRRIIGDQFMVERERAIAQLGLNPSTTVLGQGTLRPDLIESASELASSNADVIKTHHNDTPLVRELRKTGNVVEPLQDLHKDEVRELGERLGLSKALVWRQPFPGPGLAIRLLCATEPYLESAEEIMNQLTAFETKDIAVCLLPVRTVGVQGDGRTYSHLVGLSGKADWKTLLKLANEIPKQVHQVNRVVYLFGDKVSGILQEITPTLPTKDAVEQLRAADKIVNDLLQKNNLIEKLAQVPVVSFPIPFGKSMSRSIGIRTFITNDFMTGVPATPGIEISEKVLSEMVAQVQKLPGISRVAYDLTAKPPGTTEWE